MKRAVLILGFALFVLVIPFSFPRFASGQEDITESHKKQELPSFLPAFVYDDVGPASVNEIDTPCGGARELVRRFNITDNFTVTNLAVGLNINHDYRGDIQARLQSPTGTTVTLVAINTSDANDHYDVMLDSSVGDPINDGTADNTASPYYDRTVQPSNSLTAFNGENSLGTWSLFICDNGVGSGPYTPTNGTYNRSQLSFEGSVELQAALVGGLILDNDGDGTASPGDRIRYTATIFNSIGNGMETNVVFTVTPDVHSPLVVGSVTTSAGIVTTGNSAGDSTILVNVGDMADGNHVDISYDVNISSTLPMGVISLSEQGLLNSDRVTNKPTDDPFDSAGIESPTITPLIMTTISGIVWYDSNVNGVIDAIERRYDNVTLDIYVDSDGNGNLTASDEFLSTQLTTGGGIYGVSLPNQLRFLVDVTDTNNVLTGTTLASGTDPLALTLTPGSTYSTADFGYLIPNSITIVKEAMPADGTDFEFAVNEPFASLHPEYLSQWGNSGSGNGQFSINSGMGLEVSNTGILYTADSGNNRIQTFTLDGTYLNQWGGYGSGDGQFSYPLDLAIDNAGNIFVADLLNQRIQKFDSLGNYILQWGSGGSGNGQFNYPIGVGVDALGNVYVADSGNNRIQKFDNNGSYLMQWGSFGSGNGQFNSIFSIAVDPTGMVYVPDGGNSRIQKFDSTGTYLNQWGTNGSGDGEFINPYYVAISHRGNVYVSDSSNHRIQIFNSDGLYLDQWGSFGSGDGELDMPDGVALDSAGNIYVADARNNRIQKFAGNSISSSLSNFTLDDSFADDADGITNTITFNNLLTGTYSFSETLPVGWGIDDITCVTDDTGDVPIRNSNGIIIDLSEGEDVTCTFHNLISTITLIKEATPADGTNFNFRTVADFIYQGQWGNFGIGAGQFNEPRGIAIDSAGNFYVVDMYNHRIQKFNSEGDYITQWGGFGSGNGEFDYPTDVAVDNAGNILVVDQNNYRIQKFDSEGTYLRQWGSFGAGNGQFDSPHSIAVDNAGIVYVVDTFNNRIQTFNSDGVYLGKWGSFGVGNGQFNRPYGIAVDNAGIVYVADTFNHRIQTFNSSGSYLMQWGSFGAGNGQFNRPYGITVDNTHTIYVTDYANHRFQSFNTNGDYLYQWGTFGSGDHQFNLPRDLAVSSDGNVFVVDGSNRRIQIFTPPNVPAIFALDDAMVDDSDSLTNTITFSGVRTGTYIFTEEPQAGWTTTDISCTSNDTSDSPVWSDTSITIDLDAGEQITCTVRNGINLPPMAVDDTYTTTETTFTVSNVISGVLNNDSDPEGNPLTAIVVDNVVTGTLNLHEDGTFTYLAPSDFMGVITFTYQAIDESTPSNIATVTIQTACLQNASFSITVCIRHNNNDIKLYWKLHPDALEGYAIHRSTTPYYTPDASTEYMTLPVESEQTTDYGAVGDTGTNYYYYIVPLGCTSCTPPSSNHVAEFDFAITPGS